MRTLIFLLSLLFCLNSTAQIPATGLKAYYKFDKSLEDFSGNNYHGGTIGNLNYKEAMQCQSLEIKNSTSNAVRLNSNIANGLGDFSIMFYGRINGLNNSNNFISGSNFSRPNEFIIGYNAVNYYVRNGWQMRIADYNYSFSSDISMNDLKWHHIAILRDGNVARLFVDGKKIGDDFNVSDKILDISSDGLILGQDQDCRGGCFEPNQNWNGEIDELLVYSRALTAAEIEELYQNTLCSNPCEFVLDLPEDREICEGDEVKIDLDIPENYNLKWQDGSTETNYTITKTGTYKVTATNDRNCQQTDSIKIDVNQSIDIILDLDDTLICMGEQIVIELNIPSEYNVKWQDGNISNQYVITESGQYTVDVSNGECSVSDSFNVQVVSDLALNLLYDTLYLSENETFVLRPDKSPGPIKWQDGKIADSLIIDEPGIYWAVQENKCFSVSDTVVVMLREIFIPNIFTPNGDGLNDTFQINEIHSRDVWTIDVYNRYGDLVFQDLNYKNTWSGSSMAEGIYYYHLTHNNTGRTYTGWVHLLR